MEAMVNTTETGLSVLEALAAEARLYRDSVEMSLYQLARVLTQAKQLVPYGEWGHWLEENADMSARTAERMMAAYRRFGTRPMFDTVGRSKMFKLLALPEGSEEKFLEEHDVASMSAREVERAVKDVQRELEAERAARKDAERRAEEAETREPEIPEELTRQLQDQERALQESRQEIARMASVAQDSLEEKRRLLSENRTLKQEAQEREELLEEQQANYNRLQDELLDARSAMAKGDAERAPREQLTADVFAGAVRQFLGVCFRMPHMHGAFAAMPRAEWNEYDELLKSIERWLRDSRKAMQTISVEVTTHG